MEEEKFTENDLMTILELIRGEKKEWEKTIFHAEEDFDHSWEMLVSIFRLEVRTLSVMGKKRWAEEKLKDWKEFLKHEESYRTQWYGSSMNDEEEENSQMERIEKKLDSLAKQIENISRGL